MNDNLKKMYRDAEQQGIDVFEWDMRDMTAACIEQDGAYAVFLDQSLSSDSTKQACVLAHEIGHCKTGATHRLNSPYDLISKHEYMADKYAVSRLVPKQKLRRAQRAGLVEAWQLAEYFGVTEEFILRAVYLYGLSDQG